MGLLPQSGNKPGWTSGVVSRFIPSILIQPQNLPSNSPFQTRPSASPNPNSLFSTNPLRRTHFDTSPNLSAAASPASPTSSTSCTASIPSANTLGSLLATTDRPLPPSQGNLNNALYSPSHRSSTALATWLTACMPTIASKLCAKPSCVMPM